MSKKDLTFIFVSFFSWRILLFVILFFAVKHVPLQQHFLGGGMGNYLKAPWFWAWANFDGEHYLSIAQFGYQPLTYFFFPIYPIIIKSVSNLVRTSLPSLNLIGQIISNISFFAALIGLYKLVRIDFSEKIARLVIIILLLFPTSFYFASVYTESVFLALSVWAFYLARKEKWLLAGILGMILCATRVVGIIILPVLLIEAFLKERRFSLKHLPLALIPFGILAYMYFLWIRTGDIFNFFSEVGIFGAQRSTGFILLPQVFYRYIFKVLPNLNYSNFYSFFPGVLEFASSIVFLTLSIYSFFKLRISYSIFLLLGYLIPTLSGSFSSLPRYVLVLFPAFILFALWAEKLSRPLKIVLYGLLFSSLAIASAMFLRGYWVA